jgi:hypothetical protein
MARVLDRHQLGVGRIGRLLSVNDAVERERVRRLLEFELHRSHALMWVFAWGVGVEVPGWNS